MNPVSVIRKIVSAVAIVVCAFILVFILYLGSLRSYIKLLLSLTPVVFGFIQLVASTASAAVILELLRLFLPSAKRWSEKKHFALMLIAGVSLFLVSVVLRVTWKASYIKTFLSGL